MAILQYDRFLALAIINGKKLLSRCGDYVSRPSLQMHITLHPGLCEGEHLSEGRLQTSLGQTQ